MKNELASPQPIDRASLRKRMLVGAGIGLVLVSFFLSGVKNPSPKWGEFWMVRPFIIVPLAGAMGGLCNYFLLHFHNRFGINKTIAILVSVLVFIIGLWLGIILGFADTLWD